LKVKIFGIALCAQCINGLRKGFVCLHGRFVLSIVLR